MRRVIYLALSLRVLVPYAEQLNSWQREHVADTVHLIVRETGEQGKAEL